MGSERMQIKNSLKNLMLLLLVNKLIGNGKTNTKISDVFLTIDVSFKTTNLTN